MCAEFQSTEILKVLCVDTRIKIINLLKTNGPLGATEIAKELGITPAATSQHLKILKQVNLVSAERNGYWIPYSLNEKTLDECRQVLSGLCRGECRRSESHPAGKEVHLASLKRQEQELELQLRQIREQINALEDKS